MAIEPAAVTSCVLLAARGDELAASSALTDLAAVRRRFLQEALSGLAAGRPNDYELHYAFAELYFMITRGWIVFARESPIQDFLYTLILEFFRLYEQHVHSNIVGATGRSAAPQWAPYFSVAKQTDIRSRFYVRNVGLYFAAWAHTRHDLRDAIIGAYRSRRRQGRPLPSTAELTAELLGPRSSRLFSDVIRDYLVNVTAQLPVAPATRRIAGWECRFLDPLWLPHFQGWRKCACCEAIDQIGVSRS